MGHMLFGQIAEIRQPSPIHGHPRSWKPYGILKFSDPRKRAALPKKPGLSIGTQT